MGVEVLAVDHKDFELIDDLRLLVVQKIEDIAALVVGHMGYKLEADHNAKQEADHSHIAAVGTAAMMEELLGHLVHHQYNVAVVLVRQWEYDLSLPDCRLVPSTQLVGFEV